MGCSSMILSWQENKSPGECAESMCYHSEYAGTEESGIRLALAECVEKSISLLATNINDESLYLLFEWCAASSVLSIVVTDSTKKVDSAQVVKCGFTRLEAEDLQYWLGDYFTTCESFMRYSLVAAFHGQTRVESVLL
ncbi:hypothetical protein A9Q89_10485 [Gammaproteobacteria bacterium 53_120_T64]|nr:hypothetical protein A9Q89_10485 [Gammaproteobacteria bacterium 53_120_T64]